LFSNRIAFHREKRMAKEIDKSIEIEADIHLILERSYDIREGAQRAWIIQRKEAHDSRLRKEDEEVANAAKVKEASTREFLGTKEALEECSNKIKLAEVSLKT
jgi:hypothetical protein